MVRVHQGALLKSASHKELRLSLCAACSCQLSIFYRIFGSRRTNFVPDSVPASRRMAVLAKIWKCPARRAFLLVQCHCGFPRQIRGRPPLPLRAPVAAAHRGISSPPQSERRKGCLLVPLALREPPQVPLDLRIPKRIGAVVAVHIASAASVCLAGN